MRDDSKNGRVADYSGDEAEIMLIKVNNRRARTSTPPPPACPIFPFPPIEKAVLLLVGSFVVP